jgi:hypothetical protein
MVTAMVRSRHAIGANSGFLVGAGISYGYYSSDAVAVDTYEWALGFGFTGALTSWAHIDVMISGGYGITGIEVPADWPTIQGDHSDWGISGHGEIVGGLTIEIRQALLTTHVGYRLSQLSLDDQEFDRSARYTVHGAIVSVGLGIAF